MFPLNDINIVACAVATFSAAVGYNVSRRRGRNQPNNGRPEQKPSRLSFLKFHRRSSTVSARSSSSELESECDSLASSSTAASPGRQYEQTESREGDEIDVDHSFQRSDEAEHGSLKRKRSPSPAAAMLQDMSPPAKRRRTPSVGPEGPAANVELQREELTVAIAPHTEQAVAHSEDAPGMSMNTQGQVEAPVKAATEAEMQLPKTDSSPSPAIESEAIQCEAAGPANPTTPSPSAACIHSPSPSPSPSVMSSPSPKPQMPVWHATGVIVAAKPSSAFQAFSGQPSAFVTSSSSWACAGVRHSESKAPVWSTVASASNANAIVHEGESETPSPLAAPQPRTNAQKVPVVTGEEDEDVVGELKGAKVFVKRGERDFCEGILGHARLLKHKTSGAERILFRREPVWKVSMSVRLRPTVLCSFDEAQGALRVTLKELVSAEDGMEGNTMKREQVVIYALRRGKASRAEFAAFAKAVVESARLQEQEQAGAGVDASA